MANMVCRDWAAPADVWLVESTTGRRAPADPATVAHGWTADIADHRVALVAIDGRLELWIDGVAFDLATVELTWSTGDWSRDIAPTSHFVVVDPRGGQPHFDLDYLDPCWPVALIDPTFDGIDHDMTDFLYFLAQESAADNDWPGVYRAHLERGIPAPKRR